ncbi:hypothetical protein JQ617_08035 [Bradyrhizobium sp. KB893862 SZCCT0404]|uniref:hypothetical protein n=1 Tax=Bradyrhizobium sp. KB893862 SZCCT0404 TaxID=2807672 RepID=UPI001BAE48A2|nr:hypothetical protein [Bradyrhizobium sp. KB893862 SZCCT0404]MBR1173899.1 hypothetical protein [Bradyrhizobium sp. KB893862 SZCCT0404]
MDTTETKTRLLTSAGDLGVEYSQEITDDFIQDIQDRFTGANDRIDGNFLFVGSVPAAIADRWMREGYNVFEEPIRKSLARLKAENFGKFVATSKNI